MSIWTKTFWKASIERAVKTVAQTGAALLVADGTGLLETSWVALASAAGMAGLVSLLTSIGSDALTDGSGPSLTNAEALADTTTVSVIAPTDVHVDVQADEVDYSEYYIEDDEPPPAA